MELENQKTVKTREKSLTLMCVLFIVFQFLSIIFYAFDSGFDLTWIGESVLMAVMCIVLCISYRTHTKNVMKPLLGAALMVLLYYEMDWGLYYIDNFDELIQWYPNSDAFLIYAYLQIILFVVVALINIMHYVINSTHHSSPLKVKLNTLFYIIFIIIIIAQCVTCIFFESTNNFIVSSFFGIIADVFMLSMVIIIESSLDEFRLAREAKVANQIEE